MLDKIKNFFSPVKGGLDDGYTFKMFISSIRRMFPLYVIIALLIALIISGKESFMEIGWYYGMMAFLISIIGIFIFKTLQHWNDMKNHTSR